MPTYDYACAACGHRFEVVHGVHGHGPETCPNCGGGPVRKAFAPPTVVFKGSGWAKVDRRTSSNSGSAGKRDSGDESSKAKPSGGDAGDESSKAKPSGGDERSKAKPSGGDAAATASTSGDGGSGSTAKTTD